MKAEEAELLYAVMDAKNRGYEYGQMAVLLRGRAKCNLFAQRLMAAGVPVETSDSLQLCDNPGINLLISTLNRIIHPDDKLAQTTILHYLANKCQLPLHSVLEKCERTSFFEVMASQFQKPDIQELFSRWKQEPLQVTVKELIRFYDFQEDENPFIADFLDLVHEYVQTQAASIGGFLDWWNDLHTSGETIPRLSLSGSTGAVRLMTIHASKGMEFPVVITWCNASTPQPTSYWVQDTVSEQYCCSAEGNSRYAIEGAESSSVVLEPVASLGRIQKNVKDKSNGKTANCIYITTGNILLSDENGNSDYTSMCITLYIVDSYTQPSIGSEISWTP